MITSALGDQLQRSGPSSARGHQGRHRPDTPSSLRHRSFRLLQQLVGPGGEQLPVGHLEIMPASSERHRQPRSRDPVNSSAIR